MGIRTPWKIVFVLEWLPYDPEMSVFPEVTSGISPSWNDTFQYTLFLSQVSVTHLKSGHPYISEELQRLDNIITHEIQHR